VYRFIATLLLAALLSTPALAGPIVIIDTSHGKIKVELFHDKSPATVKNFLAYVDDRFYDGMIFHRVIDNFMIQSGGFMPGMKEKKHPRPPIENESDNGLSNARGTISMARTQEPNSANTQFFINVKDNAYLDANKSAPGQAGWTVFGRVVDGMDVVDRIKAVATGPRGAQHQNVPLTDVVIHSIRRAAGMTLAVGGAARPGQVFSVTAYVEYPMPGQYLVLELPAGLERVEGKELQPVSLSDGDRAVVLWKARAVAPGEFDVAVRSSGGPRLVQRVKIAAER
jgi:cyclophilin family peptidyl-prolyl cis-trans isomerase